MDYHTPWMRSDRLNLPTDTFPGPEMDSTALGMSGRPSITVSDRQDLGDPCTFPNIVMDARQSTWFGAAGQTRVRLGRFRCIPERRDGCNVQTVQTTDLPNSSRVPFNQHSQANTTSQRVESKAAGVTFPLRSGGTSGFGRDTTTLYAQSASSRKKRLESQSPQPNEVYELSTQSSRTSSSRSPLLKTEKMDREQVLI